jgi:hypothetical protein
MLDTKSLITEFPSQSPNIIQYPVGELELWFHRKDWYWYPKNTYNFPDFFPTVHTLRLPLTDSYIGVFDRAKTADR